MNYSKLTFFSLIALISFSTFSSLSPSDKRTVKSATSALIAYERLKQVSARCNTDDFISLVDLQDVQRQLETKIKRPLAEFKSLVSEEYMELDQHFTDIDSYPCDEESIELLFDQFDLAWFSFSITEPLEGELLSQSEQWQKYQTKLNNEIKKLFKQAHTVTIGTLVLTNDVPMKYKKQFIGSMARNKYSYHMEKGWKATFPRYIVADKASHEWAESAASYSARANSEFKPKQSNQQLGTKFMFFISADFEVLNKMPLENNMHIVESLGIPDWYWQGGDLVK